MVQEQVDERGQEQDRERRGLLRIGLAEVYNPSMVPTLNPGTSWSSSTERWCGRVTWWCCATRSGRTC